MVEVGFVKFILRIEHGTYHVRSSVRQLTQLKSHTFLEISPWNAVAVLSALAK